MRKNVAGQKIGAQLVSASDGSAFTGAVTVYVCGDAGTQAAGSVGSGACTHEGNGYHTYAPAQAETNYDVIAFTFTGTGAVPATVQVFTSIGALQPVVARTYSNDLNALLGVSDANGATVEAHLDTLETNQDNAPTFTSAGVVTPAIGPSELNRCSVPRSTCWYTDSGSRFTALSKSAPRS